MNWDNFRFVWKKYYPWYFLADILIWSVILGVILWWALK
jgi:hypothetical protein